MTDDDTLGRLADVIASRRGADPDRSYVARLFAKGEDAMLKKVGEEATELVMAAKDAARDDAAVPRVVAETADLWFHKKDDLIAKDLKAKLELTLPMTLRGGIRYIHEEEGRFWFDIEADVFWESWSSIDAYNVELEGTINGLNVTDLSIPKAWKDTVSVRVGGDINVIDQHLQLRAGGFWENGAVPDNYSHVDFASFDRFGVGGGLTGSYGGVSLSVGYLHVFQEDREVSETFGKTVQQRPIAPCPDGCKGLSGVIANAGKFSTSFDILSIGLDLHFSEWF